MLAKFILDAVEFPRILTNPNLSKIITHEQVPTEVKDNELTVTQTIPSSKPIDILTTADFLIQFPIITGNLKSILKTPLSCTSAPVDHEIKDVTFNEYVAILTFDPRDGTRLFKTLSQAPLKAEAQDRKVIRRKMQNKLSPHNKPKVITRRQRQNSPSHALSSMIVSNFDILSQSRTKTLRSSFKENYSENYRLTSLTAPSWGPGKIPFAALQLGEAEDATVAPVDAMCDSGASHTYLSLDLFQQIVRHNEYVIKKRNININLGKGILKAKDALFAIIPIMLRNTVGSIHTIFKRVIVLQELENTMFLGSDFLYDKQVVHHLDHEGMHMNDGYVSDFPLVPYIWKHTAEVINMFTTEDILLAPNEMRIIEVKCDFEPKETGVYLIHDGQCDPTMESEAAADEAVATAMHLPQIEVTPSLVSKNDSNTYDILITNTSNLEFFHMAMNTPVAVITPDFERQGFHSFTLATGTFRDTPLDPEADHFVCSAMSLDDELADHEPPEARDDLEEIQEPNADHLDYTLAKDLEQIKKEAEIRRREKSIEQATERINSSTYWSDAEKADRIEQFKRYGYVPLSCDEVIENSTHYTEFHEIPEGYKSDDEIIAAISLDHLEPNDKDKVLNLCRKYIDVFTRSEMDIEQNTLGVEADCILKSTHDINRPSNPKMRPFPFQARQTIQDILDKMEASGLISTCDSYSPIVSQLLIQKKKGTMKPRGEGA